MIFIIVQLCHHHRLGQTRQREIQWKYEKSKGKNQRESGIIRTEKQLCSKTIVTRVHPSSRHAGHPLSVWDTVSGVMWFGLSGEGQGKGSCAWSPLPQLLILCVDFPSQCVKLARHTRRLQAFLNTSYFTPIRSSGCCFWWVRARALRCGELANTVHSVFICDISVQVARRKYSGTHVRVGTETKTQLPTPLLLHVDPRHVKCCCGGAHQQLAAAACTFAITRHRQSLCTARRLSEF